MARPNIHLQEHSRVRKAKRRAVEAALDRTALSVNQFAKLAGVGPDILYRFLQNSGRDISLGSWERIERLLIRLDIEYQPKKVKVRKRLNT